MKFDPGEREEPPYIQEFLTSKWNVTASLGAAALAVLASFPYGLPGFIFVGTAYAAIEGLACCTCRASIVIPAKGSRCGET